MGYTVNPANLGAVFVVPSQVVDKHIKLASGQQLKVLLWVLRHANDGVNIDCLCEDLNFNRNDALDYMQYWLETGVILCDDKEISAASNEKIKETNSVTYKEDKNPVHEVKLRSKTGSSLPDLEHSKPSREEILQRAEESEDICFLLRESQVMLGRTIGYDGQCTLLMIHDTYGLPVEVILMMIEYAVSVGKSNFHYILAMGKEWGETEIDTIEKADERIKSLRSANKLWCEFSRMAGLSNSKPTRTQENMFSVWTNEWKFTLDMIYFAYEKMTNNCRNLSYAYMNKILESWHKENLKTPRDVEAYDKGKKAFSKPDTRSTRPAPQYNRNTQEKSSSSSYDLGDFNKTAMSEPLVYNKKKKN